MTVWWSQFQVGKPAQQRGHVGEDALAMRRRGFCKIIYDRGECRCAAAFDDRGLHLRA
jgi:hypothetical protein